MSIGGHLKIATIRDGWCFRLCLLVDRKELPADVHARLVAIELVELVQAVGIVHTGVVDGEHTQKILRILGRHHHGFRRLPFGAVHFSRRCVYGRGKADAANQMNAIVYVCSLVRHDAAGVVLVVAPIAEAVKLHGVVWRRPLPLFPVERAG